MKSKSFRIVCTLALVMGSAATQLPAADSQADLSAAGILKQSQAKYASLASYSDEGTAIATMGLVTAANYSFTLKLARTNLYQVTWRQGDDLFMPKGAVWSAGDGDFLWMGKGFKPRKESNMTMALASATGISGGAAACIPGTFFKTSWGDQLGAAMKAATRKANAKIGGIDCYVLAHDEGGRTNTLWIGKQDFLIHQIENDTSGAAMKAMLEEQAKKSPQIRASLEAAGSQFSQDIKSVETHQNIVINPPLTKADFDFQAPAGSKP